MLCTQFDVWEVPRGSGELIYVMDGSMSSQPGKSRRYIGRINTQELMQKAAQKMLANLNMCEATKSQQDIDTMIESC